MKAGVRFVSYDHFKHALADAEVCLRFSRCETRRETDVHAWGRVKSLRRGVCSVCHLPYPLTMPSAKWSAFSMQPAWAQV